jgi:DNA-binding transcriptional MerR regulator
MDLIPIGEAARRVEMAASALRYYDELGLVAPAARRGGRRWYGPDELRRLALIRLGQELGGSLAEIARMLRSGPDFWDVLEERIAALDEQIRRAQDTRALLVHMRACPAEDPMRECTQFQQGLDQYIKP